MKHLFVLLSLLLAWGSAQAQTEKQTPVTKLPGEENLSLRERAERDFLMPVRRKKIVTEAPKATAEENTAAPESDATAHYAETADEAHEAAVPPHTTRSYEARHTEWLAARRAARREESRAEARAEAKAEARAEARRAARHSRTSRRSKLTSHKAATHTSKANRSKAKSKKAAKVAARTSKRSKASVSHATTHHSSAKSSARKSASHKSTKKSAPLKRQTKKHRR